MGKLKELDVKLDLAFKEVVDFIAEIDTRKRLTTLEGTVVNNYNKNIKYTDDEITKLKLHFENIIEEIVNNNEVDLSDQIEALRRELNAKLVEQEKRLDQKIDTVKEELDKKVEDFKIQVEGEIQDIRDTVSEFSNRINKNARDIESIVAYFMNIFIELLKAKKSTADKIHSLLKDKSKTSALKTSSEKTIKDLEDKLLEGIEGDEEEELVPVSVEDLPEIYTLYIKSLLEVTKYLNETISALREDVIKEAKDYTDSEILKLKEYVEERLKDVKPSVDLCEEFSNLPESNKWGEDARLPVLTPTGCITVPVSTEGIFTDLRMSTSFSYGVMEGGTNTFLAQVMNASKVPAGEIEVVIVLPKVEDRITYGDEIYSNPSTGGDLISKKNDEDSIKTYKITGINPGEIAGISIPITWDITGTYQASAQLKIIDGNTIDFNQKDDYSVSSVSINSKSEGEETIDCPLIEAKIDGINIPVFGEIPSNRELVQDSNIEIIEGGRESIEVEFNHGITYSLNGMKKDVINFVYYKNYTYKADIRNNLSLFTFNTINNSVDNNFLVEELASNKLRISLKPEVGSGAIRISLSVGLNCKKQFIAVMLSRENKYVNSKVETEVVKGDVNIVKNTVSTFTREFTQSEKGKTVITYMNYSELEDLKIQSKPDSEIKLTSEKMQNYIVGSYLGNVEASRVGTNEGSIIVKPTATERDSLRVGPNLILNISQ